MFYEKELNFLRETFKKRRIRVDVLKSEDMEKARLSDRNSLENPFPSEFLFTNAFYEIAEKTVYLSTDAFGLSYSYLLLPSIEERSVLLIGPYLFSPPEDSFIFEIGEKNGVSPKNHKFLTELYSSIPILNKDGPIFTMIDTFLELVWQTHSFAIVNVENGKGVPPSQITENDVHGGTDDVLINMKAMEMRYRFENELIDAVTLGQLHKEGALLSAFSEKTFEKRLNDPIRNAKNYGIIMNTLLRKAAERGGVHPIHLDRVSSSFAAKIERMSSLSENNSLMTEMFRSYCRLVRKHSLKNFSAVVRKAILIIDSDLSAQLSLKSLAESQTISSGYLSAVFKKETGKTVSEYIREKRMKYAMHLLGTTQLQIQTVALHCGIMDIQYFSKLFKKETGVTPGEYRSEMQKRT